VLLVTITAWAEMALAPMLAMHAGHMRHGHEMAADMPAEHAGHHPLHAKMDGRLCCPGLHNGEQAALTLAASASGCDDPHSCCFRQGPQSVPAPASELRSLPRNAGPVAVATSTPVVTISRLLNHEGKPGLRASPDRLGMILRV